MARERAMVRGDLETPLGRRMFITVTMPLPAYRLSLLFLRSSPTPLLLVDLAPTACNGSPDAARRPRRNLRNSCLELLLPCHHAATAMACMGSRRAR